MAQRAAYFAELLSKAAVPAGIAGFALLNCMYDVDGGQRAVIFDRFRGVLPDIVGEGTHFVIPWLQKPIIFDVRTRAKVIVTETGSKGTRYLKHYSYYYHYYSYNSY
jgi:prohibitin 1